MKKIFSAIVVGIMLSVVLTGAGVLGKLDTVSIRIAQEQGAILPYADVNISFLAPVPLNYSIVPLYPPSIIHELRESQWLLVDRTT